MWDDLGKYLLYPYMDTIHFHPTPSSGGDRKGATHATDGQKTHASTIRGWKGAAHSTKAGIGVSESCKLESSQCQRVDKLRSDNRQAE